MAWCQAICAGNYIPMRTLFFSVAMSLTFMTSGQSANPFPYNPDADSDGWISVNDLLSLLTIFTTQFTPGTWETDSLSAAVVLDGNPSYFHCQNQCHQIEGHWRMADLDAFGRHWGLAEAENANFWVNTNSKLGEHDFNQFYAVYSGSGNLYAEGLGDLSEGKRCLCHLLASPSVPDVISSGPSLDDLEASVASLQSELEGLESTLDSLEQWVAQQDPEPWSPPVDWGCGVAVQHFGWEYATVAIGSQCWFAENLRAETYLDGSPIRSLVPPTEWDTLTTGALSHYPSPEWDLIYGRLYNWYAATDERGLCPSGWHVPTYDDFWLLGQGLGGSMVAGEALKASPDSEVPWDGTNASGFNGLPAGQRQGQYVDYVGSLGEWWTTADNQIDFTWAALVATDSPQLNFGNTSKRLGHSIRCVKD